MKVALVYISTTPELTELLEKEVRRVLLADAAGDLGNIWECPLCALMSSCAEKL